MGYKCYFRCEDCGGMNRISSERLASHPTCGRCKMPLEVSGAPIDVDDDTVDELVARSPVPVLLEFSADWCQPCRTMAPILARVGGEFAGRLFILRVDTEKHTRKMTEFGVQAIPTFYLMKDRGVLSHKQGALSYDGLKRLLERHVSFYDEPA